MTHSPTLASISLLLAAVLHFITAPERFTHASALVGCLYLFLGVFQLILALRFHQTKSSPWARAIYLSSFFLFILFVFNQYLSGHLPLFIKEPYSIPTLLRKTFEMGAGIVALLFVCSNVKAKQRSVQTNPQ